MHIKSTSVRKAFRKFLSDIRNVNRTFSHWSKYSEQFRAKEKFGTISNGSKVRNNFERIFETLRLRVQMNSVKLTSKFCALDTSSVTDLKRKCSKKILSKEFLRCSFNTFNITFECVLKWKNVSKRLNQKWNETHSASTFNWKTIDSREKNRKINQEIIFSQHCCLSISGALVSEWNQLKTLERACFYAMFVTKVVSTCQVNHIFIISSSRTFVRQQSDSTCDTNIL